MEHSILKKYNEELRYLREQGEAFAERYPKIASRLRLSQGMAEDPLVGRLFEAFAFMSARVRQKSKDELGPMIRALINLLYPII